MTGLEASPWPRTWSDFWRLTNRARPFTPRGVQLASTVLVCIYLPLAIVRHDPHHPSFLLVRGAIVLYGVVGMWRARRRLTWTGLRAYSGGLALLLPLGAAWVGAMRGNEVGDLVLTALASFVAVSFVQTSGDVVAVIVALAAANAGILHLAPPPVEPVTTVIFFLVGAIASGGVTALCMMMYRAGLRESMTWWQQACEREQALRAFAELTASEIDEETLLARVMNGFHAAFGGGRCMIFLAGSAGFQVAATAGLPAPDQERLRATPISNRIAGILSQAVAERQPIVREDLTPAQRDTIARDWGGPVTARALVALPLGADDLVAGVVVLTSREPRPVSTAEVTLWTTMARQAGIALAHARLLGRLQEALRTKSEFLNTMSHELRSPLHVVIGYADMLREEATEPEQSRLAVRIRESALDLLRLVEETLSASRLEAGRVTVRADEFAPADVVDDLADALRALPEAHGEVAVRWEVDDTIPTVRLDRLKVKEIVQNLVSNALKFTPAGEVRVCLAHHDGRLRIEVTDTGIGIPLDAQGRIFEMFERVEAPDGPRVAGVGLGLYIVRRLVGLLDGTIELQSTPGVGSSFTVTLPLALDVAA